MTKLYPILDTAALKSRNVSLETAARAFVEGGVKLLQFRHKGHWAREVFAAAEAVAELCARNGVTLVVNDRADFAMLLNAGLHLGQDDLEPAAARRLLGDKALLGFSTHNAEQLRGASTEPVSYTALGPVFGTENKQNPDAEVGLANLAAWRGLVSGPLVAIGGIRRANALEVLGAGADSVAVIGDLLPEPCSEYAIRQRVEEWQRLLGL